MNHIIFKGCRALQSILGRAWASVEYGSEDIKFFSTSCDFILVCLVSFGSMILMVLGEETATKIKVK